jgi:FkbM family methyltransferase
MTLKELKSNYHSGQMNKGEYINEMHKLHRNLFEYAEFIRDTGIDKVEISDGSIIMVSRGSNIKMSVDTRDRRCIPVEILNFGAYEKDELPMILKLIQEGDTVLDIGANIGWVSINIAKAVKNVKIFSFEPIPEIYSYFEKHIKMNEMTNIEAFNYGLSDIDTNIVFFYYPGVSGNSSLKNLSESEVGQKINSQVRTLDSVVSEKNIKVDFIKCDVEGSELLVFKGGIKTIERDKPVIFTEMLRKWSKRFDYHPNDIITFFKALGYQCFTINHQKLMGFDKMTDETVETNFIFLHSEKHSRQIEELQTSSWL